MNLAWGGIILVVLLLPGFLFFVGFYFPERFTRQLAERSPLGHLAGTVLISFVVQSVFFGVNQVFCASRCVRLDYLISFVTITQPTEPQLSRLLPSLAAHSTAILFFNLGAAASGLLLGIVTGMGVVSGPLRFLAQHTWVYGLLVDEPDWSTAVTRWCAGKWPRISRIPYVQRRLNPAEREVTAAYVLTDVEHEGRILLYRGYLKAFGIRSDGTFTYLVLVQALRLYLTLDQAEPRTSPRQDWHTISSTSASGGTGSSASLFLDGAHIANVMFDRERLPNPPTTSEFARVVSEQKSALGTEAAALTHSAPPAEAPVEDSTEASTQPE